MRILFVDIDTLRPDHMGCYGYSCNNPNMDRVCAEGIRFDEYYCSDAPCLPSRAALVSGMFGIRNGAVGHGGRAADRSFSGPLRDFTDLVDDNCFHNVFRRAGMHTASVSTFPERHSSFHDKRPLALEDARYLAVYGGKKKDLHRAGHVLQGQKAHGIPRFGGHELPARRHSQEPDLLAVPDAAFLRRNSGGSVHPVFPRKRLILLQRVAGQIEPQRLPLLPEPVARRKLPQLGNGKLRFRNLGGRKQVHLPPRMAAGISRGRVHRRLMDSQQFLPQP